MIGVWSWADSKVGEQLKLEFWNTKKQSIFLTPIQRLPNMFINIIMTWILITLKWSAELTITTKDFFWKHGIPKETRTQGMTMYMFLTFVLHLRFYLNSLISKAHLHNKQRLLFLWSVDPPSSTNENGPGSRSYESFCVVWPENLCPYVYHHFQHVHFVRLFGMGHMHVLVAHILQHNVVPQCSVQASHQHHVGVHGGHLVFFAAHQ